MIFMAFLKSDSIEVLFHLVTKQKSICENIREHPSRLKYIEVAWTASVFGWASEI